MYLLSDKTNHMQSVAVIDVMVVEHVVSMFPIPPGIPHMFSGAESMFC